ncbi:MAG: hypothetical protein M3Q36_00715 [bacterium]|nr:hypothetical protein [bacterium]
MSRQSHEEDGENVIKAHEQTVLQGLFANSTSCIIFVLKGEVFLKKEGSCKANPKAVSNGYRGVE